MLTMTATDIDHAHDCAYCGDTVTCSDSECVWEGADVVCYSCHL